MEKLKNVVSMNGNEVFKLEEGEFVDYGGSSIKIQIENEHEVYMVVENEEVLLSTEMAIEMAKHILKVCNYKGEN